MLAAAPGGGIAIIASLTFYIQETSKVICYACKLHRHKKFQIDQNKVSGVRCFVVLGLSFLGHLLMS
jgi:hypothetical protein